MTKSDDSDSHQQARRLLKACSAEIAERLYAMLEYYFEFVPTAYGMSREAYDATMEGKRVKEVLEAYRKETGAEDTYANSIFRESNANPNPQMRN